MENVNAKELKKRDLILNGNLVKALFTIALPILFYNLCNYLYGIYDMMIVEKAQIGEAADIVILEQIIYMIQTVGGALAVGGGIIIAKSFGANDITLARKSANTLFTLSLIVSGLTFLFIPLAKPFLLLLNTDEATINNALGYFLINVLSTMVITINSSILAIEKSKGNTTKLLFLNLGVIFIKILLTTLFAFGPIENVTVAYLAFATLLAQLFMLISGLSLIMRKNNVLRVWFNTLNLSKAIVVKILLISLPVFVGKFVFTYGKVFINSSATSVYGRKAVGALGISNTIAGLITTTVESFEDASATIISQNYGAANGRRIKKFFLVDFISTLVIAVAGMITLFSLRKSIAAFFSPNDIEYQMMIVNIFKWECFDLAFTGLNSVASAIFYGFGKTRITMILSTCVLFVYRIPTLLILMYLAHMDYEACGIAMFVSNTLAGVVSFTLASIFILRLNKNKKYQALFV